LPLKVIPIKASPEDHEAWKRSAEIEGMSFSAWARRALNEQAAMARAEFLDSATKKEERLAMIQKMAPQMTTAAQLGGKKSYKPDFK
jgi:hypothetical protein